ncbi:MAG: hypothetical protein ABIT36_05215 [Steroidobacteraceae bacterium]
MIGRSASRTVTATYWWEIDINYYILKVLSWLGILCDLKPIPVEVRKHPSRRMPHRR